MEKTIYSKEYRKVIHRLQKARKEAGLTQVHVAKLVKKPQSYISKLESGEQRIDIIELTRLSKLYKKPITDLLG